MATKVDGVNTTLTSGDVGHYARRHGDILWATRYRDAGKLLAAWGVKDANGVGIGNPQLIASGAAGTDEGNTESINGTVGGVGTLDDAISGIKGRDARIPV